MGICVVKYKVGVSRRQCQLTIETQSRNMKVGFSYEEEKTHNDFCRSFCVSQSFLPQPLLSSLLEVMAVLLDKCPTNLSPSHTRENTEALFSQKHLELLLLL